MSMEFVGHRFESYSKLFPDQIMNLSAELQKTRIDVTGFFDNDMREIRRIMNERQLNININFANFRRPTYLITTALYSGTRRPKTRQDVLRFLLANLYMCREVLVRIIDYTVNIIIERITQFHEDYQNRTNNYMVKLWHEFIGCCENSIQLTLEYRLFLDKIHDRLQDTESARMIDYPDRNKIREGIYESLLKTSNAQHAAMPMVRLAMELPILEDLGVKIMQKLNRNKRTKKIKDIIPTRNIKIEDAFSLMIKMRLCSKDEIAVLSRIYEWGRKSVHKGQIIPSSAIWYSYFFVTNELVNILGLPSKLSYSDTKRECDELLYHGKIKITKEGETYDPSFSNF